MRSSHSAAVVVGTLLVAMGFCAGSPCVAEMALPSPYAPSLPEALLTVLGEAVQTLSLVGPLLGLGPLVIGATRRSASSQRKAAQQASRGVRTDEHIVTIVAATPAAGIASGALFRPRAAQPRAAGFGAAPVAGTIAGMALLDPPATEGYAALPGPRSGCHG